MTDLGTSPRRGRRVRPRPVRSSSASTAGGPTPGLVLRRRRRGGQTLVEFALVFPLFILLVMAVIEFSFAFNANLALAFASRDGALVAAEAGDAANSDCSIIKAIIGDVGAPADPNQITSIEIYWSDQNGNLKVGGASNVWNNTGTSAECGVGSGIYVPFSRATDGYDESTRCNIVAGCGGSHVPSVDTIGIKVTYHYTWKTPMRGLIGLAGNGPAWSGTGWDFSRSNAMRMEPVL